MKLAMQKILITSFLMSLIACSGGGEYSIDKVISEGNIEKIRSVRKEISNEHDKLGKDIARLDSIINKKKDLSNIPLVTMLKVNSEDFMHYVELQGDVTTKQNVLVYPEASGTLINVHVKEGERVSKGQLLGTIDNGGLKSQLLQMETQLALAKTTFERQKRLWDQKIGSEIQYLQSKTNYESQRNAVSQMREQLSKFQVRAPFDGILDDIIKDQGTVVSPGPGSEIFRIVNLSNMYIEVMVPENYITTIVTGKDVRVHFPILNETINSKVKETGNYINPNNRSFNVKIPVPNKEGKVKPNMTARVFINDYQSEDAILIPQSIVSENSEGQQYVYKVTQPDKDQIAKVNRTIIETGKTQEGEVEVLSGIEDGSNLILEGARSVKDGQQVKVLKK